MSKRKRFSKPQNQRTISSFFACSSATPATEDDQPEKRQRLEGAAIDTEHGEGGDREGTPMTAAADASGPPMAESTQDAAIDAESVDNNNSSASVTVNMAEFERDKAERRSRFVSKSKHKIGFDKKWEKDYKWLVPVSNEAGEVVGMLCNICRLHNQPQRNGEFYWSRRPVASLRRDVVKAHHSSDQHAQAKRKELTRLAAAVDGGIEQAFQREVSLQREAITKAMKVLYFLAKEEIPHTTKFTSLLDFAMEHLGCDVLNHLNQGGNANYRSERILQELLQVMSDQIQDDHRARLMQSEYFGLQCDETTDVTTTKELVLLTRLVTNTGEVQNRFARMMPVQDGKAETLTAAILGWVNEAGLDLRKLKGFGSDGASVMTGRRNGVATLLRGHSPQLVAIHCIAHRLALAVSQWGSMRNRRISV